MSDTMEMNIEYDHKKLIIESWLATIAYNKQLNEKINSLSSREHQIIDLILDGKLNKEIAYELNISMSTVEAHRASIMHKMEAKTVAHFIKMYLYN